MAELKVGGISLKKNTVKADNAFVPSGVVYVKDKKDDWLEDIALGVKTNKPVLLVGPTGCGKTLSIKYLAQETNNSYRRVQLTGSTGIDNLVGRWLIKKEGTYWVDGVVIDAMRTGAWLLIDEINAANADVLFLFHQLLDDDRRILLDEKGMEEVIPHPNFRLFAAMNPSDEYAGTKEINMALKDRFLVVEVDYPSKRKELKVLLEKTGLENEKVVFGSGDEADAVPKRMIEFATEVRKIKKKGDILFNLSTRQLVDMGVVSKIVGLRKAVTLCVLNKADEEDREKILEVYKRFFRDAE